MFASRRARPIPHRRLWGIGLFFCGSAVPETTVNFDDGISISSNSADEATIRASFPAEPQPDEKPEPEGEKPPVEAKTAEPPKIDKRTREGRKLSIQQEIDELAGQKHATAREVEEAKADLARVRSERAALAAPPKAAEPQQAQPQAQEGVTEADVDRYLKMPGAPDIEKFSSIPAYNFAVSAFVGRQVFREQQDAYAQHQAAQTRNASFQERVTAETAKDKTFPEKLKSTPIDTRVLPFLHQHKQGQDIMVYLVEHPDIAQEITRLHPIDQIGRMGEIAGELNARAVAASSGPARTPAISNAKPPIKPLGSSPNVSDDVDEADLSPDEFIRRGNIAERKRQQAGRRF